MIEKNKASNPINDNINNNANLNNIKDRNEYASNIHKRIALEILKLIKNNKNEPYSILYSDKISQIMEKLKLDSTSYITSYENLLNKSQDDNDFYSEETISKLTKKEKYLYSNLLKDIETNIQFNVELVKHGKSMNCTVNRYAMILYPKGIWSMKHPLKEGEVFNESKAKDKTPILKHCSFVREEQKNTKTEWTVKNKNYRLRLTFPHNKSNHPNDHIYLYFDNESKCTKVEDLLNLIKLRKKDSLISSNISNSVNLINNSNIMYGVLKMIAVKNQVLNNKQVLSEFKFNFQNKVNDFNNYMTSTFKNMISKYKHIKDLQNNKKNSKINLSNCLDKRNKLYTVLSNKNIYQGSNNYKARYPLEKLKDCVNIITDYFPEYFRLKHNKLNNINSKNSNRSLVRFKTANVNIYENELHKNLSFAKFYKLIFNNCKNSYFSINKKDLCLIFNDKIIFDKDLLSSISSLMINSNLNGTFHENSITINGPKINNTKYINYSLKNNELCNINISTITNSSIFVEPDHHKLCLNQIFETNYKALYLQIYHLNLEFDKEDLSEFSNIFSLDDYNINDILFYLEITFGNRFKKRTSIVEVAHYSNNIISLEFNCQFLFNYNIISNIDEFDFLVSLKAIPKSYLNKESDLMISNIEYIIDYLNPLEIANCYCSKEDFLTKQNKIMLKKSFNLKKDFNNNYRNSLTSSSNKNINLNNNLKKQSTNKNINLSFNNYLIYNIEDNYNNLFSQQQNILLKGYNINIGTVFFIKETLDKEKIENLKLNKNKTISNKVLRQLNAIQYDTNDNYILLRLPNKKEINYEKTTEEDLISQLKNNKNITSEIIEKIYYNSQVNFLPYICKFTSKESLKYLRNLKLEDRDLFNNNNTNDLIYKLPYITKHFLCVVKAVSLEKKELVYYNYFTSEVKVLKFDYINNLLNDKCLIFSNNNNNNISIYNLNEIENKSINNYDNNNYQWKLNINFINTMQMNTFLYFLKKLISMCFSKMYLEQIKPIKINEDLVLNQTINLKKDFKKLNIIVDKFDFKKSFNINKDYEVKLFAYKNSNLKNFNSLETQGKYIVELLFNKNNSNNYINSITSNKKLLKEYELISSGRDQTKEINNKFTLNPESFNKSDKSLVFSKDVPTEKRALSFDVKAYFDKLIAFEVNLIPIDNNNDNNNNNDIISLKSAPVNFDYIIEENQLADFLIVPLFSLNKNKNYNYIDEDEISNIVGYITINTFIESYNIENKTIITDKAITFSNLFEKSLLMTFIPKDAYNNYINLGKYEPNVYRRNIKNIIFNKFNVKNISELSNLINNNKNVLNSLYSILKSNYISGADELLLNNESKKWTEFIVDTDIYYLKEIKDFYVNYKKNDFFYQFCTTEWEMFLYDIFNLYIKNSKPELKFKDLAPYSILPSKKHIVSWKKGLSSYNNTDSKFINMIKNNLKFNIMSMSFGRSDKKQSNNNVYWYNRIRNLIYIGIPNKNRIEVYYSLMEINNLTDITYKKISDNEIAMNLFRQNTNLNKDKLLYMYFEKQANELSNFYINFSLIDNDIDRLVLLSDDFNYEEENRLKNKIKTIAKAYFMWTELNIFTNIFEESSSYKKKYVYFFGILHIIQKLLSVFDLQLNNENNADNNDYFIFWILIGLSQNLEIFYQINPLFNNKISYNKAYVMVTKLILKHHLKSINNKFISINFPIDYFVFESISCLFSNSLQTDCFLRVLDIIIFESSIIVTESDKFDALRLICTIPLTLIEMCKDSILQVKSVREMEIEIKNTIRKTYNTELFIQQLYDNMNKYFTTDKNSDISNKYTFIDNLIKKDDNTSNGNNTNENDNQYNSNWHSKRENISKQLCNNFKGIEEENKMFLSKILNTDSVKEISKAIKLNSKKNIVYVNSDLPSNSNNVNENKEAFNSTASLPFVGTLSINDNTIKSLEKNIGSELDIVRNVYSTGTAYGDISNNKNYIVYFIINKLYIFNKMYKQIDRKYYISYNFDNKDNKSSNINTNYSSNNNINKEYIEFDNNHNCITNPFKEFLFDYLPKYLNISLHNVTNNEVFATYSIDLLRQDLLRPSKIKVESNDNFNKTIIEIGLMKYSKVAIVESEDANFYKLLFESPSSIFNQSIYNEMQDIPNALREEFDKLQSVIIKKDVYRMSEYLKLSDVYKNKLLYDEFKSQSIEIYEKLKLSFNKNNLDNTIIINNNHYSTDKNHINTEKNINNYYSKDNNYINKNYNGTLKVINLGYNIINKLNETYNNTLSYKNKENEFYYSGVLNTKDSNTLINRLNNMLNKVFADNKKLTNLIINWISCGNSTFEEIMISLALVDSTSVTVQEKLKLIFDIVKMQNYLIFNDYNTINERKLKSLVYSLYKRFMIDFSKNESDRMVDYALSKDSLHNFFNVFLFDEDYKSDVYNILDNEININDNNNNNNNNKSLISKLKIKNHKNSIVDVTTDFNLIISMLKNKYDISFITNELMDAVVSALVALHLFSFDNGSNKLCIEIINENVKTTKFFDIQKSNDFVKSNNISSKYKVSPIHLIKNNDKEGALFYNENVDNLFFYNLLKEVLFSLEINNNESTKITFDNYLEVIYKLPYIGDLIRGTCSFVKCSIDNTSYIMSYNCTNVSLLIKGITYNFIFTHNFDRNSYIKKQSNYNNIYYYNMNKLVYSSMSFSDILNLIKEFIDNENLKEKDNITEVIKNTKYLSFNYILDEDILLNSNTNNRLDLDNEFKLYEPFYSNYNLRNHNNFKNVNLKISTKTNQDISVIDQNNLIIKKNGFSKLINVDGHSSSWVECKIKDYKGDLNNTKINSNNNFNYSLVNYNNFSNKYYFLIPKDYIIYDRHDV